MKRMLRYRRPTQRPAATHESADVKPHRTRRLFWQLLGTFALLIIFGIGGTTALINVAFRQISTRNLESALDVAEPAWAASLGDYYTARGRSWRGVDQRLERLLDVEPRMPFAAMGYVLLDEAGRPVARGGSAGVNLPDINAMQGTPIIVNGERVGTLALQPLNRTRMRAPTPPQAPHAPMPQHMNRPLLTIERSFFVVALVIGSLTLLLAAVITRRISSPLATMTHAAQRVADGDLRVHVPRSTIFEVDTLAQAFNQMAHNLAHADQLRRNITADVAHELRTPLTIIKGKLEGMLDGVYPGTTEHLTPVLEEANLLERLIEDLRLLSLAEAGQLPLQRELVPVGDLLADAHATFATHARAQQIVLSLDPVVTAANINVDPQRMQQVLGNLLANSLRHTPPEGRIDLRAEQANHTVRIIIRDTGSGIAPEDLPHIFDRFWRGDRARSRQGNSTGLGLAIARQFVEAQGGRISAESQPGVGTTMMLDFPRAAADSPPA